MILILIAVGWWMPDPRPPSTDVAAGEPLPTSPARIEVLEPETTPTTVTVVEETALATPISATAEKPPAGPSPNAVNAAKLGLSLTLLQQAVYQGSAQSRPLAETATTLAAATNNGALAATLAALHENLAETGPVTMAAVGATANDATTHHTNRQAGQAAETATANWWQRQLQRFITLRRETPQADNGWQMSMAAVRQNLALNNLSAASRQLQQAPLAEDAALNDLRRMLADLMAIHTQLDAVLQMYAATYLQPEGAR